MQIFYRMLETNVNGEWLPLAVALPDNGAVTLSFLGNSLVRSLDVPGVAALDERHLWAPGLRWSEVRQCSAEAAITLQSLLSSVGSHGLEALSADADELLPRGASMEEIAAIREPKARTPAEAILELKRGNSRFYSMHSTAQNVGPIERRSQIASQTPFAAILGCSDSRVPLEFIFDQGPGNLFITRVAGNVCGPNTLASLEYAVCHLKTQLVLVLGHESCGAVAAALLPKSVRDTETEHVRALLELIVPGIEGLPVIRDRIAKMREAAIANVREQVYQVRKNAVMREYIAAGKIAVVGGFYSISSGAVDILESEEDLAVDPARIAADAIHA